MILLILFILACFLAYSNGANDNFKGVATLFGSGTTNYKVAIRWGTITTFFGSVAAIFLASSLIKNFSGKGLIPDELLQTHEFAISIALGAGLTVFLATKIGLPISTTHALVGALMGSGVLAVGSEFNFSKLGGTFLIPLIVSPLVAAVISLVLYITFRKFRLACGVSKESCICLGNEYKPTTELLIQENTISIDGTAQKKFKIGKEKECMEIYRGQFLGVNVQRLLDYAHFLSSGVVSFARGLNDTPKIMGLLLVINALDVKWGMLAIAFSMAIGGIMNARKVGVTVAKKITPMNHGQGFTANLVTGLLVTTASVHGLPVSTTHVSVGSIFGIGTINKNADIHVIRNILLSWLLTLPLAALCGSLVYWLLIYIF